MEYIHCDRALSQTRPNHDDETVHLGAPGRCCRGAGSGLRPQRRRPARLLMLRLWLRLSRMRQSAGRRRRGARTNSQTARPPYSARVCPPRPSSGRPLWSAISSLCTIVEQRNYNNKRVKSPPCPRRAGAEFHSAGRRCMKSAVCCPRPSLPNTGSLCYDLL